MASTTSICLLGLSYPTQPSLHPGMPLPAHIPTPWPQAAWYLPGLCQQPGVQHNINWAVLAPHTLWVLKTGFTASLFSTTALVLWSQCRCTTSLGLGAKFGFWNDKKPVGWPPPVLKWTRSKLYHPISDWTFCGDRTWSHFQCQINMCRACLPVTFLPWMLASNVDTWSQPPFSLSLSLWQSHQLSHLMPENTAQLRLLWECQIACPCLCYMLALTNASLSFLEVFQQGYACVLNLFKCLHCILLTQAEPSSLISVILRAPGWLFVPNVYSKIWLVRCAKMTALYIRFLSAILLWLPHCLLDRKS